MTERKKKSRFLPGLLLYLLILALLLTAALFVFRDFLACYEATRPARALEAYRSELREGASPERFRGGLAGLDTALQSEDEALQLMSARLKDARIVEDVTRSGDEECVYRLLLEGTACGEVRFRQQEPGRYGFAPWALSEESYDFSPWFYRLSVTVPADYRVSCGDTELNDTYHVETGIRYELLGSAYDVIEGLPTLVRYETGPLLCEAALQVCDVSGRVVSPEEQNENRYLDSCSPEQKEQTQRFAEDFIAAYVRFTSVKMDFGTLKAMVVPGSSIDRRLNQAVGESWWSGMGRCTLLETRVNYCLDLGDRLLLDVSYETETQELANLVHNVYNARFVLTEQNGKLLAEHFFNY